MSDKRAKYFVTDFAVDRSHERRDIALVLNEIGVTMSSENGFEKDNVTHRYRSEKIERIVEGALIAHMAQENPESLR
ncbi:MAG TPA: hypothetical protein VNA66_01425, partial [Gammaproteobacteria bacterium]|nr:hypothetical protein [Gammaproteobacteria bacterium]